MKTCAGIVLYNADIIRLKENINSILSQVDTICLVDNGSSNYNEIDKLVNDYKMDIWLIHNEKNQGIAKALNQILDFATENKFSWFLTLDQDTITNPGLIECYKKNIGVDIGQLSCNIKDRNIGVIDAVKNYFGNDSVEIDYCITSGCFNNTEALNKVGGYSDELFIDGVDLDISCKLRKAEYKILNMNFDGILHELGNGERRNILGKEFIIAYHAPWRNYYARRNIIYVARKYYSGLTKIKMIMTQIAYGFGIVILEDKKCERMQKNLKGIMDGLSIPLHKKYK